MWAERPKLYQGFFCPMSDRETTHKLVLNVFQLIYSLPSPCGKMHTFGYQQRLKSFRLFGWAFYKLQDMFQQQETCVLCSLCVLCSAAQCPSHPSRVFPLQAGVWSPALMRPSLWALASLCLQTGWNIQSTFLHLKICFQPPCVTQRAFICQTGGEEKSQN